MSALRTQRWHSAPAPILCGSAAKKIYEYPGLVWIRTSCGSRQSNIFRNNTLRCRLGVGPILSDIKIPSKTSWRTAIGTVAFSNGMIIIYLHKKKVGKLMQPFRIEEGNAFSRTARQHAFRICILSCRNRPSARDMANRNYAHAPSLDIKTCDVFACRSHPALQRLKFYVTEREKLRSRRESSLAVAN